jgi:hypothetical protein
VTHYRRTIRDAVAAAVEADATFSGATRLKSWGRTIDADKCPVYSVTTPREQVNRAAVDQSDRTVSVFFGLRRAGGDELEDTLDADSAAAEAAILPALDGYLDAQFVETRIEINHDNAATRIGTLLMEFRAVVATDEGAAA